MLYWGACSNHEVWPWSSLSSTHQCNNTEQLIYCVKNINQTSNSESQCTGASILYSNEKRNNWFRIFLSTYVSWNRWNSEHCRGLKKVNEKVWVQYNRSFFSKILEQMWYIKNQVIYMITFMQFNAWKPSKAAYPPPCFCMDSLCFAPRLFIIGW